MLLSLQKQEPDAGASGRTRAAGWNRRLALRSRRVGVIACLVALCAVVFGVGAALGRPGAGAPARAVHVPARPPRAHHGRPTIRFGVRAAHARSAHHAHAKRKHLHARRMGVRAAHARRAHARHRAWMIHAAHARRAHARHRTRMMVHAARARRAHARHRAGVIHAARAHHKTHRKALKRRHPGAHRHRAHARKKNAPRLMMRGFVAVGSASATLGQSATAVTAALPRPTFAVRAGGGQLALSTGGARLATSSLNGSSAALGAVAARVRAGAAAGSSGSSGSSGTTAGTSGGTSRTTAGSFGATAGTSGATAGTSSARARATRTAAVQRRAHPKHKSSPGPPESFLVPSGISQPIEHFVSVVPTGLWIALFSALGLAAAGGAAAVHSNRRARRQASEYAAVAAVALTDPLTGVLNRRGFGAAVERELARARRYGNTFVIAYVDIRGLKTVNDSKGHLAGDAVIKQVARLLGDSVRAEDAVGRLGGDELALLLTGPSADATDAVVERVQDRLPARRDSLAMDTSWDVTVGTAAYPEDGATFEELLATADRRLYEQRGIRLR